LRLVVDASTLVAELLRERGHKLLALCAPRSVRTRVDVGEDPARGLEKARHQSVQRVTRAGCGVATWTVETLITQLERRGESSST
jgi:hypothetical protein